MHSVHSSHLAHSFWAVSMQRPLLLKRGHTFMQVCATIGLCDAPQLSQPARKLLAQAMAHAQRAQQPVNGPLAKLQPAQQSRDNLEESTQCQICEMAVNYVKVRSLHNVGL